jgi:hypothetical protein
MNLKLMFTLTILLSYISLATVADAAIFECDRGKVLKVNKASGDLAHFVYGGYVCVSKPKLSKSKLSCSVSGKRLRLVYTGPKSRIIQKYINEYHMCAWRPLKRITGGSIPVKHKKDVTFPYEIRCSSGQPRYVGSEKHRADAIKSGVSQNFMCIAPKPVFKK